MDINKIINFKVKEDSAWSSKAFTLTWLSSTISQFGDSFTFLILPIWILSISHSPILVSSINVVVILMSILFSSIAGTIADKTERRKIMIICNVGRFFIMVCFVFLAIKSSPSYILILVLVGFRAIGSAFFSPASSAALSTMVEESQIRSAITIQQFTRQMVSIVGPLIGGIVVGIVNYIGGFAFDAFSFIFAAVILYNIKFPREITSVDKKINLRKDFSSGFSFIKENKALNILVYSATMINLLGSALTIAIQIALINDLKLSTSLYGVIIAASPAGMAAGSIISKKIKYSKKGLLISLCIIATGLFNFLMGVITIPIVFGILFFFSGIAFGIANVNFGVLYRNLVPIEMQGRFFGALNTLLQIASPLGMIVIGFLLVHIVSFTIIIFIGLATLITGITMMLSKEMRKEYG